MGNHARRFPEWLTKKITASSNTEETGQLLRDLKLNTVCESAVCPNQGECFSRRTATFMILGENCTRNCRFCAVTSGAPLPLGEGEADRVAEATARLGLKHVVVTSVTRDDLHDGGASHFAAVIESIRKKCPTTIIEVLTPDFLGEYPSIDTVTVAKPNIYNHNMETVPNLYSTVRPQADYTRSLKVLERVKTTDASILTKSGMMLGLGEKEEDVFRVMQDLRNVGCDILTLGQYLSPSPGHLPVQEYVHPKIFNRYKQVAQDYGFFHVASAPFVRSSYFASDVSDKFLSQQETGSTC